MNKLLKKGKGLLRSVVTSSGDGIVEDAALGTAEEVGVDALIGVTAVAEAPLIALAVSTALVVGV